MKPNKLYLVVCALLILIMPVSMDTSAATADRVDASYIAEIHESHHECQYSQRVLRHRPRAGRWYCQEKNLQWRTDHTHEWRDYQRQARQLRAYLVAIYVQRISRNCRPGNPGGCEALIRITAPHYGVNSDDAVAVGRCESGLNPTASNGSHGGIFQQANSYWASRSGQYGYSGRSIYDPVANVNVSLGMVRDTGGWSHWSCKPG